MLIRLFILIFLLGLVPTVDAATITAASCSKADVRAAIKATANSGDTVLIPPGTCHWTGSGSDGGLGIYCDAGSLGYDNTFCKNGSTTRGDTKQLTIKGAGIGQTIIYDDIAKNADPPALINWQTKPGGLSRISGIEFRGGTYNGSPCPGDNLGSVMISGNTDQFRMDNNKFVPMSGCTAFVMGTASGNSYLRGVIDHNTIDCSAVSVCTNYFNGASWQNVGCCGDNSWAQPDTVGTSEALFLEDNVWINNQSVTKSGSFCMDGWAGFRVVMRYNSIRACSIGGHGTDSAGGTARGLRQLEFYNNTFTGPDGVSPWNMGGAALTSVMSARSGVAVVFNNTILVTNGNVLFAFDGSNFRDFQAFPPWGQCNGSSPYDQNSSSGGYRCIDQVGAGYGQLMQTGGTAPINTTTGTAKWPNQVSQPGYVWNNTVNGAPVGANGTTSHVVVGRDLINAPRPFMADGVTPYRPYTYPHPLVSGSGGDSAPPAPPTGLKVS
jgi:hypothetical protein